MDKKKIAGVLGALVCATSFFAADLSTAEAVTSAATRERYAEENKKYEENASAVQLVQGTSREAMIITPVIHGLQKRIAQYNNLVITDEPLKEAGQYKNTLHPMVVVDCYRNALSTGNGHLYFGIEDIRDYVESRNFNSMNHFDYMALEKTIAHETGHSIKGNEYYSSLFTKKSESSCEQEAEDEAIALTDNLPEGGWGIYTMTVSRSANRIKQIKKNLKKMEEQSKRVISLNDENTKYNGIVGTAAACDESSYIASNGKSYKIVAGIDNKTMRNFSYKVDPTYHNDNAYLAGQIAECIAKDAFKPENLAVISNNLTDISFAGDYLLVCKSSNLPNGYRVLASLYGEENDINQALNMVRNGGTRPLAESYNLFETEIQKHPYRSAERSGWVILEVCSMAVDNAARAKN